MYGTLLNIKTIILYPQTEVLWKQAVWKSSPKSNPWKVFEIQQFKFTVGF